MSINSYINSEKERFLEELFQFLRIPSVSSKTEHGDDMYKTANFLKEHLIKLGVDKAEVMPTNGHPIVYAEKIIDKSLPTILVYGHYDVQPAEPFELWKSKPFEPEIREGKIYARGADDDKGQLFMHVKAFEYMVKHNELPCNVKFMIEGEEEVGSVNLGDFCAKYKEMLKSDIILVSDTGMISLETPSITVGLRGLAYMQVEVTGPNRDLHSGLYGGAVANPINILCKMIASLTDENNRITIPEFYDDVMELSDIERQAMAKNKVNEEEYKNSIGINAVYGEKGYSTIERTGIRPTLDVNGIWGGYIEEGAKTIIPSKAYAKISMRLVPNQNEEKIAALFENHFKKIAPEAVSVKVEYLHGGSAYVSPTDSIEYKAATKAIVQSLGVEPIPTRSGGSIPIVALFEKLLGVKTLLLGFGLESDAIHSPNENYPLANFFKGIETITYFYSYYSKLMRESNS